MEGTRKQKNGIFQKVKNKAAAVFSGLTNDMAVLTDAVPDKSYMEKKPEPATKKPVSPDDKCNSNAPPHDNTNNSDSCDDDEDEIAWEKSSKTKSRFKAKSKNTKDKDKRYNSTNKGERNAYYLNHVNGVHIGNNINMINNLHVGAQNKQDIKKPKVEISKEIQDAFSNNTILTTDHLLEVQSHIGKNWRALGKRLGFSEGQLDQFFDDFTPQKERIYQMLRSWIRIETKKATVGILCQHMWEVNEKEAVERLVAYINNSTNDLD